MSRVTRRSLLRNALLGASAVALPGTIHSLAAPRPASAAEADPLTWRNWAGDHACRPRRLVPRDEDELCAALRRSDGPLRPVGAGHSFSPIVRSDDTLVACDLIHGLIDVDAERLQAEAWAGTRLHALANALAEQGQTLTNQPDIDDQVLAGAIATSTHGTGATLGSLSAYVTGITLVSPEGERLSCDAERESELFQAARCSLGALGVATRFRLQNRTPCRLAETTRLRPIDALLAEAEALRDAHRHMEFMALPHSGLGLLVTTDETEDQEVSLLEDPSSVRSLREAWGAVGGQREAYHQVILEAIGTEPQTRVGPAHLVLAHARYVRFREMEYTVPAEDGPDCLAEILRTIETQGLPVVFPIEYRYVRRDDVWLSMFEGRDGATISLHQYADEDHRPIFEALEPIFWRYGGRPHWGKLHSLDASRLASLYPHWDDFQAVRRRLDPKGRMANAHLDAVLGSVTAGLRG